MQTITIPYVASDDDKPLIAQWQRLHACVVRTGYARSGLPDGKTMPEKDLRNLLKSLFPMHPLGSWAIHCATREALRMRKQQPDGRIIFGGRDHFERRARGLISRDDWRRRRQSRPIEIVGDRTRDGNRHLNLSGDGLKATVKFLGRIVTLNLPQMSGKTGYLVRALALLTDACEVGIGFTLGSGTLTITYDPMDLRRLPPGMTLEQVQKDERDALGHSPRGRPRNDPDTHDSAYRIKPVDHAIRPVHPEWRTTVPMMTSRAVGVDLNPQWIGLSVIEIDHRADARNADAVRILDHRLIRLDVPIGSSSEALATHMARAARMASGLARKWHAATIFHEDGLGKLRWSKKSRGEPAAQLLEPERADRRARPPLRPRWNQTHGRLGWLLHHHRQHVLRPAGRLRRGSGDRAPWHRRVAWRQGPPSGGSADGVATPREGWGGAGRRGEGHGAGGMLEGGPPGSESGAD